MYFVYNIVNIYYENNYIRMNYHKENNIKLKRQFVTQTYNRCMHTKCQIR